MVHVDGTARAQTVDPAEEPAVAALLAAFERRTGLPCLVNTSLNTAGRPMVDDPRDALELFGSAPVDVLVLGPLPGAPAAGGGPAVTGPPYSVVVPTVGRPSLAAAAGRAGRGPGPAPAAVVVVDDRPEPTEPLAPLDLPEVPGLQVVRGGGRGPAAARNAGWRATTTPWVAFLDDDVLAPAGWPARLAADLAGLPARVAGSQGRLRVPLPADRRPTDWERGTAGLAAARWATADMAYRRRGAGPGRRLRRALRPGVPGGRRPGPAAARRRLELVRGDREVTAPGAAGAAAGRACGPSAATPTTR